MTADRPGSRRDTDRAEEVDVIVLGMGPGGEYAAGRLAEEGLSVAGIEARLLGGECPYWGCVPSKMMIRAADLLAEGTRIPGMAGTSTVRPDWRPVARRIRDEATDNWDDKVAVDRFTAKGGRFIRGRGRLTGPREVTVDAAGERRVIRAARAIVINTGTPPAIPPIDGLADTPYWTNREAIEAEEVPGSLIVLGGGSIGVEFSQMFARFGARLTVVEAAGRLLPLDEPEAGALLAEVFGREGIAVMVGAAAAAVGHDGQRFTVTLAGGGTLTADRLLVATGRQAGLADLGVAAAGIDPQAKTIDVDERMRVVVPNAGPAGPADTAGSAGQGTGLWAIGDVTGRGAFTHVSMYQADIAVRDILGQGGPSADYRALPRVTFTDPEIGVVGLTEAQAAERGIAVRTGHADVPSTARGFIHKVGNDGFIKLIEDSRRGVLVGATSVGPWGGEVLGALAVAVHGQLDTELLAQMIFAYPTFHRGIEAALQDLRTGRN
jgi:pyruvate/2-oxoglutarate dehydrogenase complex dihydrolipoamide dehydrogenase (E3) component